MPETFRRSRWLVPLAVVTIVVMIGTGFWFAAQFQSSAQQEADARAPAPGTVVAEVARGSLAGEAGFTGQVGPSTQIPVTVLPAPDASLTVVTGHPVDAGATVSSGQVLTEVNGRPFFGVQSEFSFYRDMGVGDSGPDVAALQAALRACSYRVAADGRFGSETAAAVERWYQDSGYEAPTRPSTDEEKGGSVEDDALTESGARVPSTEEYVPVSEILAIPGASAQVVQGTQIGQRLAVEGIPDLILGSADLVVTVTVPVSDLDDVVAGDAAMISIDGAEAEGVVGDVHPIGTMEAPDGQEEPAAPEVVFAVIPKSALPMSTGRARVTVIKQIVAEDALIVPVLAISDRGPDKQLLTKQQDDGSFIEVPVTVLGTLQGEAAVEPLETGALESGDRVRVG